MTTRLELTYKLPAFFALSTFSCMTKWCGVAVALVLVNNSYAETECSTAKLDPTEIAICEQKQLANKDEAVSRSYARLSNKLTRAKDVAGNSVQLGGLLATTQHTWTKYRKAACQLRAGVASLGNPSRGQAGYQEEIACLMQMADQRLQQLEELSSVVTDK